MSSLSRPANRKSNLLTIGLIIGLIIVVAVGIYRILPYFSPRPPSSDVKVIFTSPKEDTSVPNVSLCEGTITEMPSNYQLWLVVYSHRVGNYHPQNGPVNVEPQGAWSNSCHIGRPTGQDVEEKFDVLALMVDGDVGQAFKEYLEQAPNMTPAPFPGMETLPEGVITVGRVKNIVREPETTSGIVDTSTPTLVSESLVSSAAHPIYMGAELAAGYDMGVNTSGERTDWVTNKDGAICMAYPSGQQWGAVFITMGEPTNPPRPGQDLSNYQTLSLELRGEKGGEQVWIGLKDNEDPDDGTETKRLVSNLTTEWQPFTFPLSDFETADLTKLYVVTEFVFEPGTSAETVCFRNIQYLP